MCGIAGCVVANGRRPERAALERMAHALEPRGPDGEGIEIWENVGLVNRRLAIVDPSEAGAQPISDPSGRWTLTYNGEVYNHRELRRELDGRPWAGHSDSETLVRALCEWEGAAVDRCNGPLALAALDRRERRLLLARDRFEKKPLYVARDARGIWFASEMRALLAAGIRPGADHAALVHTVFWGWLNGPRTPLAGVERLRGGTLRSIDLDSLRSEERTWFDPVDLVDPELAADLGGRSRIQLSDELDRILGGSVERRLMSDVPVGTMLSGGLDSSLVTALAGRASDGLVAFSASIPSHPAVDETHHAERAARALGIPLEIVSIEPDTWRSHLVNSVRLYEYPLYSSSVVMIEPVAARARERGVKVLLTGEGADELLGGYGHLHVPEVKRFLPAPIAALRGAQALRRHGRRALVNMLRRRGLLPDRARPFPPEPASVEMRRDLLARAVSAYARHDRPRRELEAALLTDLAASAFGHLLTRMDKNAMGASIETRLPFLDPEVARFVVNLPLERRVALRSKSILREVAARYLPRGLAVRAKQASMHFRARRLIEASADPRFLGDGALRDALEVPAAEWGETIASTVGDLWLWSAEIWARLFLEGRSVEQIEAELWRQP